MSRACLLALLLPVLVPLPLKAQPRTPAAPGYEAAVKNLDAFIAREVAQKRLPALSVALVDDRKVVWGRGYGFADPAHKTPATADTVYRVGSISKLFTDLAILQLVDRGALDLDDPITKYLPAFKPGSRFDTAITLRHLMSHRAGLVREPPVGSYFDPDGPSLEKTVTSLNLTELVHEPGTKTKYSNAGIAVVGLVVETSQKQPFPRYLQRTLLAPLEMTSSSFEPEPGIVKDLAKATMWTYHGREFPAPTFELGTVSAGCMYATVNDLAKFLKFLFAGGKTPTGALLEAKTLEQMWTPQFVKPGTKEGYGLGFQTGTFEGRRRIRHGGAIYGFATELSALPDDRLGVVVIASRDGANAVTTRIAEESLRQMLAVRAGKPLPTIAETTPLKTDRARALAGLYQSKEDSFELTEREGRLYYWPGKGGSRVELRGQGESLTADDALGYGLKLEEEGGRLKRGKEVFERRAVGKPADVPDKWRGLIGEYGPDHNTLIILERNGRLHALIEWFFLYPLEEESENVFAFPTEGGLYPGEKLVFTRDGAGRAKLVEAAGVPFERRSLAGETGTFKIKPLLPIAELRKQAVAAKPPEERGLSFHAPELVELTKLDPSIKLDIRYATTDNFLSTPFYPSARAFLQKPAAEALVRVHRALEKEGLGLMVFDGYRPWSVTKMFWDATPPDKRIFVADPMKGSRHNRGCAVDLTLFDRKTGKAVAMTGGYDEMSDRSYPDYPGGTSTQRSYRDRLRRAMEAEGFTVYEAEWWHFDYRDWNKYSIQNLSFEEIAGKK
jgi:serine beta-lactamase-like protein LACTB